MGLLNKTFDLAKKATGTVWDTAGKKINDARQKREEEERKFFEEFPYKNRYIIRQKDSVSLDLVLWEVLERDSYVIYNADEEPVYIAKGTVLMGKHHFVVTDPNKQEMGKVRKALINVPIPFMKERKTCTIEVKNEEPFELETCISFNEREYTATKSGMTIKADTKDKEFQIFEKKGKKPIIHIYKVRSDEGFFKDKYVIGFDEDANKMLAILMTIGIDAIRFSED